MDKFELEVKVKGIVEEFLKGENVELVELAVRRQNRDLYIKILADKPEGGITIEECARINSRLTRMIDEGQLVPEGCAIEVSSPGLDRPLTTQEDFTRCRGKLVEVFLKVELAGKFEYSGTIENVDQESVDIKTQDGAVSIPLSIISKAKQII